MATLSEPLPLTAPDLPNAQDVLAAVAKLAAADAQFAATLSMSASPAEALERFGLRFFQENKISEATALFRSAVALAPENPVMWTNYGAALDRANSFAEAAACLEQSLALAPRQPDTWLLLGLVRKKSGDLVAAEEAYRQALQLEPKSFAAWQCLGLLKEERKDYFEAIECLTNARNFGATDPAIVANLAKLSYEVGRLREAAELYDQAVVLDTANAHYHQMAQKARFMRDLLDGKSVDQALSVYECSSQLPSKHTQRNPQKDQVELLQTAFGLLSGFGHIAEARRVGKKYLEIWPDSAVMGYQMKAIEGEPGLSRSPSQYVSEFYDSFADGFDTKLVDVLGYDVPQKTCDALRNITPAGHKYEVLDIGCGTGLAGPLLRPMANTLTGVDLSPRMLEHASKRGVYDELACEDLLSFLSRSTSSFDLINASDVVIYLGDMSLLFKAAAAALKPAGLFAFSTELWPGDGYRLQTTGRFAHSPQYIRSLAAPNFIQQICEETTIRLEAGKAVRGSLFIFRKKN